jgi:hypothetical protein
MLLTNQRLDKLAASRVDFVNQGLLQEQRMLPIPVLDDAKHRAPIGDCENEEPVNLVADFVVGMVNLA